MNTDDPNLDPNLMLKKKGSKTPLIIVGVLAAGGIGFAVLRTMQQHELRKTHAAFLESFANIEREEVGKFWTCILGPNVDAAMFPDNLALSQRITSQFGVDAKNYPNKVREECTPKAIDAKHKVDDLKGPSEYEAALKKYATGLKELATAFDAWTKIAPAQVQDMEVGKALDKAGAAWHSFGGGKPDADVIAFDRFLHCAVPTVDSMKDGQALVEYLFAECKKPEYLTKLNETCGRELIADPPATEPTKGFQTALKKIGGDDRDLSAFDDCLRKSRKGKRRDDLADVGKAWLAWLEAGREVRTIGKEMLKE